MNNFNLSVEIRLKICDIVKLCVIDGYANYDHNNE